MTMLDAYALKGVEWGSLSASDDDDDDGDATSAAKEEAKQETVDDTGFARPKTRNVRRKGAKERKAAEPKVKIHVFSDIWTWKETPFQLQAIVSSEAEMERLVKRLKLRWAHGFCAEQKMIWNFDKGKRTLHLPTPEYLARFENHIA